MKNTINFDFTKNFAADVSIESLMEIGWNFDADVDTENYHIEIYVDESGATFWNFVNTQKKAGKIWEGSDREATGDDAQTIEDLKALYASGLLWNCEQL